MLKVCNFPPPPTNLRKQTDKQQIMPSEFGVSINRRKGDLSVCLSAYLRRGNQWTSGSSKEIENVPPVPE